MIRRTLQNSIEKHLFQGKAVIIIGARQVGKSTLLHQIIDSRDEQHLFLECDDISTRQMLTDANIERLRTEIGDSGIVVIDEAQLVPNIGRTLKIFIDNIKDVQLLVSGSSALELRNKLNEPLTGRKFEYRLFGVSTEELYENYGQIYVEQTLEQRIIFGSYPDIINHSEDARELITNIADSYLYKDLLAIEDIRKPDLLNKILVALALQLGDEVSYNELAQTVGSDNKTVEKYIDFLEKCFVIFRLNAFSRNLRNEVKKNKKIYFYDTGVRNAIIRNFAPLALRNDKDKGGLWENFFILERIKYNNNKGFLPNYYFWRTTGNLTKEIDFIEEIDGRLSAFEVKWNKKKADKTSLPQLFLNTYDIKDAVVVSRETCLDWIL